MLHARPPRQARAVAVAVRRDAGDQVELAERSIFAATYRDAYSGGTVRIYHIDADGWKRIRETDSMELYFKFKAEATAA